MIRLDPAHRDHTLSPPPMRCILDTSVHNWITLRAARSPWSNIVSRYSIRWLPHLIWINQTIDSICDEHSVGLSLLTTLIRHFLPSTTRARCLRRPFKPDSGLLSLEKGTNFVRDWPEFPESPESYMRWMIKSSFSLGFLQTVHAKRYRTELTCTHTVQKHAWVTQLSNARSEVTSLC